jgi:hypothetical protein
MLAGAAVAAAIAASQNSLRREMSCDAIGSLMVIPRLEKRPKPHTYYSPRSGRNPKTDELIRVPETAHAAFKTGTGMHRRLNADFQ